MEQDVIDPARSRLLAERAALVEDRDRGRSGEATVTLDQQAVGRLSRMDALQNQAMARAQSHRRDAGITRIDAALARLAEGEWGYCTDCGDALEPARLAADPAVPRCLDCLRG